MWIAAIYLISLWEEAEYFNVLKLNFEMIST